MPAKTLPDILAIESVAHTALFHIEALELQFQNGARRRFERFMEWTPGVVIVVPILNDSLLLIREYCAGAHDYVLTLPKGKVDAGEFSLDAANRELQEEIGYGARSLTLLRKLYNSASYSSTSMEVILAQDLYESVLVGDEPEPIEVVPWPLDEIPELIMRPEFSEGRSIAALYLAQLHLGLK